MVEAHRNCGNVIPLSEASKNIKSSPIIEELSAEIENIISTVDKLLQNGNGNLREIENQEREILDSLSKTKKQATDTFDKADKSLKKDLAKEKKVIEEKVKAQDATMIHIQKATEVSDQELKFVERFASDVQGYHQLRKVKQDLRTKADELETSISKITKMSMKYDNATDWCMKSLGSVSVEVVPCPIVYNSLYQTSKPEVSASAPPPPVRMTKEQTILDHAEENTVNVLEIPVASIRKGLKIKSGQFSDVFKGTWASVKVGRSKEVVVKEAKDNEAALTHLKSQINILATCNHTNIITLYGICVGPPVSMVMEFMTQGNLSQFLGKMDRQSHYISERLEELASIAVQVCNGMEYLNSKRIVHTDLSAKNVLIADGIIAKITGFGMAKILINGDTFKMDAAFPVPIKWTAPEVLLDKTISIMSDVWSFGILMVERIMLGQEPYPRIKKQDLIPMMKSGYRHPQPEDCSDLIYDILLRCWNEDPNERPTFDFLYNIFDTVEVINDDDMGSDDLMSIASNEEENLPSSFGNLHEYILPTQRSKSKKKQ
ncbi:tyrosine protein-kinase src-1-like [Mytilus californianus]|uniref:tyrosine protein-kinase src-1-like n=1 Tax=Mytilus californianus TaxID=6549 RepID=UPI0022461B15|nr:tyrosine protein-kinase src-1-like [Mytilus californianus]